MPKQTKYHQVIEPGGGRYSAWLLPTMRGHKMACCDCGLTHDLDFRVVRAGRQKKDGFRKIEAFVGGGLQVQFRARRNKRATKNRRATLKRRRVKK